MRNRSRCPFFASDTIASTDNQLTAPWATMSKWLFRVKTWQLSVDILDNAGTPVGGGTVGLTGPWEIGWNYVNNRFITGPGLCLDEAHLATGWQMFILDPDFYQHGGVSNITVSFFASFLLTGAADGYGAHFDVPANNVGIPFLLQVAGSSTSQGGTSAVTGAVDGVSMNFDDGGQGWTGSWSMDPFEYWEYRRADNTNPMYNSATGAALLPQQTDELP